MIIKLPVELAVVISLMLVFLFWLVWLRVSTWWLNKKYNPHNDKSRQGKEKLREGLKKLRTGKPKLKVPTPTATRQEKSGGQDDLQIPPIDSVGKDSKSPRGFFTRRRKK